MRGAALLVMVCACSERALSIPERTHDPAVGDLAVDPLTPEEFADQYAQIVCERDLRCGFLDEEELDSCLAYQAIQYLQYVDRSYEFHASAARGCLELFRARDCLPLSWPNCGEVFTPSGKLGEPCAEDCGPGMRCAHEQCPPVCVRQQVLAEGQPCSFQTLPVCVEGTYCPYAGGVCTPVGERGAPCETSIGNSQCKEGLVCQPSGDRGACEPPAGAGEPCSNASADYLACRDGLVCQGRTYPHGTCGPFVGEGEECYPLEPCGEGLRCMGIGYQSPAEPGHCKRPVPEGQPCTLADDCRDFTTCQNGICQRPFSKPGESCDMKYDDCLLGYCSAGICVSALELGAPCDPDGSYKQCRSGYCTRATATCGLCP